MNDKSRVKLGNKKANTLVQFTVYVVIVVQNKSERKDWIHAESRNQIGANIAKYIYESLPESEVEVDAQTASVKALTFVLWWER